jgi:hypothetical protein
MVSDGEWKVDGGGGWGREMEWVRLDDGVEIGRENEGGWKEWRQSWWRREGSRMGEDVGELAGGK